MHGGVHADLGFQHAADHALHAVHLGGRCDLEGVVQAAALHQLDVHEVCGSHLHDGQCVLRGEHALVGQHRHIGALGNILQAFKIVGLDRLLHEFDIKALLLHSVQDAHGFLGGPALICVDADAGLLGHSTADGAQACNILFRLLAHLDLQAVVAAVDGVQGIAHHLFGVVDADGDVGDDGLLCAAHQLVHRDFVQLAVQIPQGHIHSSLGAGVLLDAGIQCDHQVFKVVHIAADDGLCDMVADGTDDGTGGVAGDHTGGRCLTITHSAGVGVDLYDHIFHAADRTQSRLKRHAQRHGDQTETYFRDFHAKPTPFDKKCCQIMKSMVVLYTKLSIL